MFSPNPPQPNYSGPTTTANSAADGRLMVDASMKRKKKAFIKKTLKKQKHGKN